MSLVPNAAQQRVYVPTAEGLAAYAEKALHSPNLYLWGGIGEYLTDEILDEKIACFPDWYIPERVEFRRQLCNRGLRGYDCIGLIESYLWNDYHQGNPYFFQPEQWYSTAELIKMDVPRGPLDTLPERPGMVLWRKGHVGVYMGQGRVIEMTCRRPGTITMDRRIGGVVETTIAEVAGTELAWTRWLEFPGIKY